jgi:outer membrane protein OmpA-like peptidoglycan-associated protein
LPFLATLALAACVSEQVVLLPSPTGEASAIVVRSGCGEQALDQPYQTSKLQNGSLTTSTVSKAEVDARFGETLAHMPPSPSRFVFYFPEGSSELTAESYAQLPRLREAITHYPAAEILIVGHTDTVGDMLMNDALSLERARTLSNILDAEGFDDGVNIEVAGRGERELLIKTADEVSEPRNRRVVVNVR